MRLPESVPPSQKAARVEQVIGQLGLEGVADTRIGSGERRGVSGGEMRRVSIGLELVGRPDVLVLDEPTSGLDSVSAARVTSVLWDVAHDQECPTAVIASIHQPRFVSFLKINSDGTFLIVQLNSSKLYHTFDSVLLLAHGRALYSGPGGLAPAQHFATHGQDAPPEGYNVADYLLEVASDPPAALFQAAATPRNTDATTSSTSEKSLQGAEGGSEETRVRGSAEAGAGLEKGSTAPTAVDVQDADARAHQGGQWWRRGPAYAATFLTQFEVLAGREWKILRRCACVPSVRHFLVVLTDVLGPMSGTKRFSLHMWLSPAFWASSAVSLLAFSY